MAFKTASKNQVVYSKLDIADRSSVENLASSVKEKHGLVDVLINNAGVNVDDEYSAKNVKVTLDTNVRGTLQVSIDSVVLDFESGLKREMVSAKTWAKSSWECPNDSPVLIFAKIPMASIRKITLPNCFFCWYATSVES